MVPQPPLREAEAANWDFFLNIPETDRKLLSPQPGEGRPAAAAAVRVLRRLLRLRRDAVHQADDPALRRPRDDRQCHRLLLHLRRQPADHALLHRTTTAADRPGPTRCSRTTPSSAWACGWPSTSRTSTPANWSGSLGFRPSARIWPQALLNADQKTEAGIFAQRERVAELKEKLAGNRHAARRATS